MKKDPIIFYIISGLITVFIIVFCLFTIFKSANNFVAKTGKDLLYFYKNAQNVKTKNNFQGYEQLNILLLGLDSYDVRPGVDINSDTILLTNINFTSKKISLISLPRDLWSFDQNTKINRLYDYAIKNNKDLDFVKEEFSKVYGQKIDKVMVLDIDNILSFVKIIGPLEIDMENDYKDEQYPNPEYELNPRSGAPVYTTVEFKKGINIIDEKNILPFVRSRKGSDFIQAGGTDLGRINRQQKVIDAILQKSKNSEFWLQPQKYIDLYNLWQKDIKTDVTDSDIMSLISLTIENINQYKSKKINLPISEIIKEDTIIYHPKKVAFTKQWIYLPVGNTNYNSIHEFINKSLLE